MELSTIAAAADAAETELATLKARHERLTKQADVLMAQLEALPGEIAAAEERAAKLRAAANAVA